MGPLIAIALFIGAALYLVGALEPKTMTKLAEDPQVHLIASVAAIIFLAGGVIGSMNGRTAAVLKHTLDWALFFVLLFGVYTYRADLSLLAHRMASHLASLQVEEPQQPNDHSKNAVVRVFRASDGHFIAHSKVNGVDVKMLWDTGASNVTLSYEDAQRVGVDLSRLDYGARMQTANGESYAALVRLDRVSIGPVIVHRVEALVARPGALRTSLLGMSFLSRLDSYNVSGNILTLKSK